MYGKVRERISELAYLWAMRLEKISPGHRFALKKLEHIEDTIRLAHELRPILGLNAEEFELLLLCASAHDLGRPIELLRGLDPLRPGLAHAELSAEALEESGVLVGMTEQNRRAVIEGVLWHSARIVDLHPKSLGYKLCYALRDLDKLDLFEEQQTFQVHETVRQLDSQFLPVLITEGWHSIRGSDSFITIASNMVEAALENDIGHLKSDSPVDTLHNAVRTALWRGIPDPVIEKFVNRQPIAKTDINSSFAVYVLLHLAFFFDIQNIDIKRMMYRGDGVARRLNFLAKRIRPDQFELIQDTLDAEIADEAREQFAVNE